MSYSEFKTIAEVRDRFELRVDKSKNYNADIPPVEVREFLQQILEQNIPLANAINTERACSELLNHVRIISDQKIFVCSRQYPIMDR